MRFRDKILIVDDDKQMTRMLYRFLSLEGYVCKIAYNGKEAIQELLTNEYNLCLLDVNIPDISGLEILSRIKSEDLLVSIIMMTGSGESSMIISAMRAGADDYLKKPFEMEEVLLCVQRAIKINYLRFENRKYRYFLEKEVTRKTEKIRKSYYDIIRAFSQSIEMRDSYTGGHNRRVSVIAELLGKAMGFSLEKQEELRNGGMLHDIGKIAIPDTILKKKGMLTDEEFSEIRKHPMHGYNILKGMDSVSPYIPYVLYHHERYDGKGYPGRLSGEEIPVEARILSLADALDAMTSDRSYRKTMTDKEAYEEIISCSGTQFDPKIVGVFSDLWERNLVQSLLRV